MSKKKKSLEQLAETELNVISKERMKEFVGSQSVVLRSMPLPNPPLEVQKISAVSSANNIDALWNKSDYYFNQYKFRNEITKVSGSSSIISEPSKHIFAEPPKLIDQAKNPKYNILKNAEISVDNSRSTLSNKRVKYKSAKPKKSKITKSVKRITNHNKKGKKLNKKKHTANNSIKSNSSNAVIICNKTTLNFNLLLKRSEGIEDKILQSNS